ncbi:MAG: MaoC family dehydratase N-terminal domain-containing protein [Bifidobacteriaceae bacterium]|jgi:acyl dehydratase|nr:MaoC family dehydratase N-terminal domain-containing protein [Bifidobacteriaceae bacterium]
MNPSGRAIPHVGAVIGQRQIEFTRQDLVRYAGASGDLNPIHYSDTAADSAGLPGVIAHGMATMGAAIQLVVDWIGDPGAILDYSARFSKPVPVPYPGAAVLDVTGTVGEIDEVEGRAVIVLAVSLDGNKVLGKAKATVSLTGLSISRAAATH